MREFSGFPGVLYSTTEWVMRFSVVNILWMMINVPIVIILLSLYANNFSLAFLVYYVPLLILFPLLFFPSTTGMFAMARDWLLKIDHPSLTKAYFSHIKSNYKKSVLSGLVLTLLWLIWLIDFYYFKNEHELLSLVFSIMGFVLFVFTINYFSLNVHFQMNIRELLKNTFLVTIGSPFLFFVILISNFLLFYLSATKLIFLIPLFTGSVSAYLSFALFYRFSLKMQEKATINKSA
ncbi:YesL family protein [Psychrobacillus sp. NPDC096623]|uniref:YesL family protein n=1 Tax=Psychrobacillus sp. NPDC096623 TaxID=3364492 RepID=UPI003812125A